MNGQNAITIPFLNFVVGRILEPLDDVSMHPSCFYCDSCGFPARFVVRFTSRVGKTLLGEQFYDQGDPIEFFHVDCVVLEKCHKCGTFLDPEAA